MPAAKNDMGVLDVRLGDVHVGTLTLLENENTEFSISEEYRQRYPRPVLGQFFEDDPTRRYSSRMRLPPFFSNLLPEGYLRELIAEREGIHKQREFFLIARLGEDLPGAVIITPTAALRWDATEPVEVVDSYGKPAEPLRFSLAGVQLKFSMLQKNRGMTLPMGGKGGDWIVKLPDNRFDHVPENEFSMMAWAQAAGIRVPEFHIERVADLEGLPTGIVLREQLAYAVRRFDRPEPGHRIHMEDLAQVLGLYSDEKYKKYNYETVAKIIFRLTGNNGLTEFLRRLVFIVAIGNGDAHHKNWSLVYPDGVSAELSPAYDLVSTIQYMPNEEIALNLARSKRFEDVTLASFARLARKLGVSEEVVLQIVQSAVEDTLQAWSEQRAQFPIPEAFKRRIEEHFKVIPLLQGR